MENEIFFLDFRVNGETKTCRISACPSNAYFKTSLSSSFGYERICLNLIAMPTYGTRREFVIIAN